MVGGIYTSKFTREKEKIHLRGDLKANRKSVENYIIRTYSQLEHESCIKKNE